MDYGHTNVQNGGTSPFFTAGVGNSTSSANDFEPENNLDLTSKSNAWSQNNSQVSPSNYHDPRFLGGQANRAIFSGDINPIGSGQVQEQFSQPFQNPFQPADQPNQLGVITDVDPTPAVPNVTPATIREDRIHPQGDRISKDTTRAVGEVIREFKAPLKPLSGTYQEVVAMRQSYLKNLGFKEGK